MRRLHGVIGLGLGRGDGEDTSSAPNNIYTGCSVDPSIVCTVVQIEHPTRSFAAPFDGVIVRWRIYGATPAALRVLHPVGGAYMGAGSGATETAAGQGEHVFAARLPIQQGDLIGVNLSGSGGVGQHITAGATFAYWMPALADGETQAPSSVPRALLYNADVEPDADNDGFGDETQDQCPGETGSEAGCPGARLRSS